MTNKQGNKEQQSSSANNRLYRSEKNKILGGVAGGLGEFFNLDPTIVRIIFILLTIFGGSGFLIYLILWIIVPSEGYKGDLSEDTIRNNVSDIRDRAQTIAHSIRMDKNSNEPSNSKFWWALLIIILGFLFLFNSLDILDLGKFWPFILIILGLYILLKRRG